MPLDSSPRSLQSFTMLVPVAHRVSAQEIANRRFISLSDFFREAIAEKIKRETRDEARANAR